MNGCIIPEENEKSINPQQENAIFLVMGDEAYTDEMIDEYNRNAEAKTEEFNTNATNKLNAFNENATTKTNAFNTNATTQTDTYNSNAATKLSEYNDNATAKEQSYNSNADTKTQAFNQNAAQKEYEFNQNALAYQEGIEKNAEEIDEVSNRVYRIENNLYDSGTAEGYFINIEDSSYSEFQNVSVDGVCEQETTHGIQLFNANAKATDNITVNDNGKTIIMAIAQEGNGGVDAHATLQQLCPTLNVGDTVYLNFERNLNPELNNYINLAGEDYIWYVGTAREITQNDLDGTVYLYGNRFIDGETEQCILTNFRITRKNEDLFEPYTGGQPSPSPDYPQPIEVIEEDFNITSCGKNLLPNNITSQTINGLTITKNDDNSVTINGTTTAYTALSFIENFILPKGDYTLSYHYNGQFPEQGSIWTIATDLEDNQIFGFPIDYNSTKTLNENTTFSKIGIAIQTDKEINNLTLYPMIEQGIEATEYEPYQGTTTAIVLPDEQFAAKISDTTKDQFRISYDESDGNYHLYLDKNVGKVVLDGSESWKDNWQNSNFPDCIYFYLSADFLDNNYEPYHDWGNLISNNFQCSGSVWNSDRELLALNPDMTNTLQISMLKSRVSDLTSFKQWLQSHNTTVYYELATPQTIDLGKIQMPLTYYPITNVLTDCPLQPNIEVAYYRDFKTTIETMQEDIASNTSRIETLEEQLQSQATTISNLENRVTALEPAQTESEVVEQ